MQALSGLSAQEVRDLAKQGKANVVPDKTSKSTTAIVLSNVFTYFNGIFTFLAVLLVLTGSFRSLTFLPVVIANTIIGIVQQLRAKKVLDNLALLDVSTFQTIRDGVETPVPRQSWCSVTS